MPPASHVLTSIPPSSGFDSFTVKFNHKTFITNYLGIPVYLALFLGYKLWYKTKLIPLKEVDLITGKREFDEDEALWAEEEAESNKPWWKKLWDAA